MSELLQWLFEEADSMIDKPDCQQDRSRLNDILLAVGHALAHDLRRAHIRSEDQADVIQRLVERVTCLEERLADKQALIQRIDALEKSVRQCQEQIEGLRSLEAQLWQAQDDLSRNQMRLQAEQLTKLTLALDDLEAIAWRLAVMSAAAAPSSKTHTGRDID